jgi:outer membrane protein assembly factor BamA
VNLGVTSGGNFYGGTAVTFTDVLGDRQVNLYYASISQYRTMAASLVNISRRFQYALQGFSQTQFFYGIAGALYDPAFAYIDRDFAIATRTVRGGTAFGIYPLNRYARLELSGGIVQFREQFDDPALEQFAQDYQQAVYGTQVFRNGTVVPFGVAYVQETTIFREFGPLAGSTMRVGYEFAPKIGDTLSSQTADLDLRYYLRLGTTGLLALRGRGYRSWGAFPNFFYFGGNSEMHGYEYLEFAGNRGFFGNAELRFPLIEAMATPVGVLGGIRGMLFFNIGAAGFNGQSFKVFSNSTAVFPTIVGYNVNFETNQFEPIYGDPKVVSGFRLQDGRASYGVGLETFALGFPIHFDWSWRTLFNRDWEDVVYSGFGGSSAFRKAKFTVWIGYDF